MAKAQSRKTASRSAIALGRAKSAHRTSTKAVKAAPVKKSSSAPARPLDQPTRHRAGSKQARVIEMLMKPEGAMIGDIMQATNWQQHSVRGFFAGVIRKKLKLTLISEATEAGRIYKVTGNAASAALTRSKPDKTAA
ncbi:DUF3489 domain-containing protein [Nitrobacter sp. TKz-YC01]|uniref:DUF3489 domain-containing protein n=1 Tax=Nitrobacter sp. TKz-YC01 TaxID=3398703 RepID=UPI003A0FD775